MVAGRMYAAAQAPAFMPEVFVWGWPVALLFSGRTDMVALVSSDHPFAEPIELPKGKKLVTLRDAAL
jgi:hypothetical protein